MSVYQNINGTLARMDASDLVQLAAVDTEGILGGTPGATTDGQTLVDQLAADDVQAQTDIGQIKTDLSDKLDIVNQQELGAYNLADCDMATSTLSGFTATKGTLNGGVTYTITGANTGSTGAQFIIEDDAKFLAQMKRYAGKRLKLVGCPAGGNSTSGYFLAVYFNYGAGDTPSSFYDLGEGNVMTVPETVNTARLAITLRHAATFSNTVFRPMVTPVLSATYEDFVGFAMTNRELTEVKDGAISYENGIGQQYALDVPLKKQGNVCMLSISLVGIVLSQGTWGSIGTLPVGFRPYKNVGGINVVKNASGGVFDCEAQAGGTLRIRNNSGAVTSTDIVHFNGVYYAP